MGQYTVQYSVWQLCTVSTADVESKEQTEISLLRHVLSNIAV